MFGREFDDAVAPVGIEPGDARNGLDAPGEPAPRDKDDEVDRFGDETARPGDHGFLDQLLESIERGDRAIRMDRRNAAGRPGRSEGSRVGKEGVSTGRSRWSPAH